MGQIAKPLRMLVAIEQQNGVNRLAGSFIKNRGIAGDVRNDESPAGEKQEAEGGLQSKNCIPVPLMWRKKSALHPFAGVSLTSIGKVHGGGST